jgi:hypothetical protein
MRIYCRALAWLAGTVPLAVLVAVLTGAWAWTGLALGAAGVVAVFVTMLRWISYQRSRSGRTPAEVLREPVGGAAHGPTTVVDMDQLRVGAVYRLGKELLAWFVEDRPEAGAVAGIEGRSVYVAGDEGRSGIFLAWEAPGRAAAQQAWRRLTTWQAQGTCLRLVAYTGRPAFVVENEHSWVALPELRAQASRHHAD